jgi:hypothetical protein
MLTREFALADPSNKTRLTVRQANVHSPSHGGSRRGGHGSIPKQAFCLRPVVSRVSATGPCEPTQDRTARPLTSQPTWCDARSGEAPCGPVCGCNRDGMQGVRGFKSPQLHHRSAALLSARPTRIVASAQQMHGNVATVAQRGSTATVREVLTASRSS